ncbi:MAG TPA: UDP-N-acetylmuramate--L-alanine ligase [Planctomycetes bacterium]|nr:UDP-N-acetylmuramate--L-alanine ligase [Planctomycetota bacterium]
MSESKLPIEVAHLIGIGGSGMSGLARFLHGMGVKVSGSDHVDSDCLEELRELGIEVFLGHSAKSVNLKGFEKGWVVRSAAIPEDNPELVRAREKGLPCFLYAEAVGKLSEGLRTLAVAGTHGKTSTTALCVSALRAAGLDPSYLIGGQVPGFGGNGRAGSGDLFVVEACEFNRSFHALRPTHAAILNLDPDHFDCYPEWRDLEIAFAGYAQSLPPGGRLFVHEDLSQRVLDAIPGDTDVCRIGSGLFADLRAIEVEEEKGCFSFTPMHHNERYPRVRLQLAGGFQVLNALFALGLAMAAGADPEKAALGLSSFAGVNRRFQIHTGPQGGKLVDDYAHHPAEIVAVLRAARQAFPGRKLVVGFQAHQYSRTKNLLDEFAQALALADHSIIAEIYPAREDPTLDHGVDGRSLAEAVREAGGKAEYGGSPLDLADRLLPHLEASDAVPLILGAGELDGLVQELVRRI